MKFLSVFSLATAVTASLIPHRTTTIAGVEVIDTRIVRDAQALIRQFPDYLYSHQMRSWLFGVAMINANETLKRHVDLEVHAIATMLHDLGWDRTPGSRWVSPDKRFEVDGAIGARTWLSEHPIGRFWAPERVRKVFQSIALHGSGSIVNFFELEETVIVQSIGQDYHGPTNGVTQSVYDRIAKQFPQDELISGTNDTFTWLARTKPATTWDTWVQPWGDAFVEGYSAKGHRSFDNIAIPKA
ncbi:putative cyanamide hydratase [Rosellinia necatrix]|uniref:Putative cyanamide hydratase n=1 Tax=Rosellinia necatrix TaxID=77044 RepID=A0A1W2TDC3_ROSNE|nr:putative cyanamide hydratase [Rosellinia necatrix]